MTKTPLTRLAGIVLLLLLAVAACLTVPFFDDPNPGAAIAALTAWACLLVAIYKVRLPRGPKE